MFLLASGTHRRLHSVADHAPCAPQYISGTRPSCVSSVDSRRTRIRAAAGAPGTATSRPQIIFTPHAPPDTADAVGLHTLRAVTPPAKKGQAARQRSASAVFGSSLTLNGRRLQLPPIAAGGPDNAVSPRQVFPPATPLSGRPPFKTRNPAGGKTFLGGHSTAAFTARLAAWGLYRRVRLAPSLAARRRQRLPGPLRRLTKPPTPDLRGQGRGRCAAPAVATAPPLRGMFGSSLTITNCPLAPSPPRNGGRALRFCTARRPRAEERLQNKAGGHPRTPV